jgi:hypothetical protein
MILTHAPVAPWSISIRRRKTKSEVESVDVVPSRKGKVNYVMHILADNPL